MDKEDNEIALFRLMVLGPLVSRDKLSRGELKIMLRELASRSYTIPCSRRSHLSEKTIERWYYQWHQYGFEGLRRRKRSDSGRSTIPPALQAAILQLKRDNPGRSLNTIKRLLETQGKMAKNAISRATLHRFLKQHELSKHVVSTANTIERRSFVAEHAGDIWYGDVMHGPSVMSPKGKRKTYLVSLMDDASRLIVHSAFCWSETALDIEGVLKQGILRRGRPKKLVIDNGAAYRAKTLQMICAKLEIRLVYCRPYEPEGKGKLERWHRTCREIFLSELEIELCKNLEELNARLWAWIEQVYHQRPHQGLGGHQTPIERWREDIAHIRPLGHFADKLDEYFYYRFVRQVRKDGCVCWSGLSFEVPYQLVGQKVNLVIDPHNEKAIWVESIDGKYLGDAHPLDKISNTQRHRQRPEVMSPQSLPSHHDNEVELALKNYRCQHALSEQVNVEEED